MIAPPVMLRNLVHQSVASVHQVIMPLILAHPSASSAEQEAMQPRVAQVNASCAPQARRVSFLVHPSVVCAHQVITPLTLACNSASSATLEATQPRAAQRNVSCVLPAR